MDGLRLTAAMQRLREEFDRVVPRDEIEAAFRASTDELTRDARVDNFVPLLAERRARERLLQASRSSN
jgi:hypothetical protein